MDALQVPDHSPIMLEDAAVVMPLPSPRRTPFNVVVTANVPALVTGELATEKPDGMVSPTLVTVPPPPPPPGTTQEPSPRKKVVESQVPDHRLITLELAAVVNPVPVPRNNPFSVVLIASVPDVVMGEPVTLKPDGTVNPTLVTVPAPPLAA